MADIWSFGLILLELSLGKYPYPAADNYFKLLAAIMDGEAPKVRASLTCCAAPPQVTGRAISFWCCCRSPRTTFRTGTPSSSHCASTRTPLSVRARTTCSSTIGSANTRSTTCYCPTYSRAWRSESIMGARIGALRQICGACRNVASWRPFARSLYCSSTATTRCVIRNDLRRSSRMPERAPRQRP